MRTPDGRYFVHRWQRFIGVAHDVGDRKVFVQKCRCQTDECDQQKSKLCLRGRRSDNHQPRYFKCAPTNGKTVWMMATASAITSANCPSSGIIMGSSKAPLVTVFVRVL